MARAEVGPGLLAEWRKTMAHQPAMPPATPPGSLGVVAELYGPMPTGVTVSQEGRLFVNFPRRGDPVDFTVAEIVAGNAVAYPDEAINRPNSHDPSASLLSVQSVVVDPSNRLWILDTGSIEFGSTAVGGPKLVGVDLRENRVVQKILVPPDVAPPTTYLND